MGLAIEALPDSIGDYPFAIAAMVCGAVSPYLFFRWRKWMQ